MDYGFDWVVLLWLDTAGWYSREDSRKVVKKAILVNRFFIDRSICDVWEKCSLIGAPKSLAKRKLWNAYIISYTYRVLTPRTAADPSRSFSCRVQNVPFCSTLGLTSPPIGRTCSTSVFFVQKSAFCRVFLDTLLPSAAEQSFTPWISSKNRTPRPFSGHLVQIVPIFSSTVSFGVLYT